MKSDTMINKWRANYESKLNSGLVSEKEAEMFVNYISQALHPSYSNLSDAETRDLMKFIGLGVAAGMIAKGGVAFHDDLKKMQFDENAFYNMITEELGMKYPNVPYSVLPGLLLSYQMVKDTASQMSAKSTKTDVGATGGNGGKKATLATIATALLSGCLDENPIDKVSDDTLKDISNGEFKDADGTMYATLYKQAMDASGKPTLDVVSQNVKVVKFDVLPSGTPAVTYTPATGGQEKQEILGPGNTMIVKSKDGKQHMILGAQEMDGWTVVNTMPFRPDPKITIPVSKYNNNIIGDSPGDEVYATLSKDSNGKVVVNIFYPKEVKNGYGVTLADMSSNGKVNVPQRELSTYGAEPVKGAEGILFKQFPLEEMNRILPGFDMVYISPGSEDKYRGHQAEGMPILHVQNKNGWDKKGPFE